MHACTRSPVSALPGANDPAGPQSLSAVANPGINLQPRAVWADLPEDIIHQLMAWLMRTEGTEDSVNRLAIASKNVGASAQAFRNSASYAEIRSAWDDTRMVEWTRAHLGSLQSDHCGTLHAATAGSLRNMLLSLSGWDYGLPLSLLINESSTRDALTGDWLQGFRDYSGRYLSIRANARPWESGKLVEIAHALPRETCIALQIEGAQAGLSEAARLIGEVASTRQMTGFSLLSEGTSVINLAGLDELLRVLCVPGRIQWLRFNALDDASPLLAALAVRCSELHALRLVTIECDRLTDEASLVALRDALLERQRRGKSRVSFGIHCADRQGSRHACSRLLSSESEESALERAGLFFGQIRAGADPSMAARLYASVGEGPPAEWRRSPATGQGRDDAMPPDENPAKCIIS